MMISNAQVEVINKIIGSHMVTLKGVDEIMQCNYTIKTSFEDTMGVVSKITTYGPNNRYIDGIGM